MPKFFALIFFLTGSTHAFAQESKKNRWVDSVFSTLKKEEKIGQLFMIPVSTRASNEDIQILKGQCRSGKIGGLLFEKSGPVGYERMINLFQSNSRLPIIVGADVSPDIAQAFDSVMNFFSTNVLDVIANDSLRQSLKQEINRQKNLLHLHFSFHPGNDSIGDLKVIDVRQITVPAKAKKGEEEKQAFLNGNNLLISPKNIDAAIKVISKVIKKDKVLAARLDQSIRKVLAAKYDAGLSKNKLINVDNLFANLNTPGGKLLKLKLAEASVAVARNENETIPIRKLDEHGFVSISIGKDRHNEFTHFLSKYADFRNGPLNLITDTIQWGESLTREEIVVVGLYAAPPSFLKEISPWMKRLSEKHQLIVVSFAGQEGLGFFENASATIVAYSEDFEIQQVAAEIIFGGISVKGRLPTKAAGRFAYSLPEDAGMNSLTLKKIESIAKEAISFGATPGCQVLIAKDGKVVYERSFGNLSYDKKMPVSDETIYDLASVTKVSATLQTVMYMHEKGLIDINKKASVYLPELKGSNKEDMIIKDILTHQAGLWPYLPFWSETVKDTVVIRKFYGHNSSDQFPFSVAENLYASRSMKDSLWQWIIKAKVREKPSRTVYDYRYSDMGFYIMQHLAEKMLGQPMEEFLQKNIYRPIGATSTGYLPLRRFPSSQIAPTENDTLFRKSLLVGYVHDQGAAMHGGVAGHAGLFSNANDLAKLGQLWLNKGSYGGVQIFKPETVDFFTTKQYEGSRRGLGWDKPILNSWDSPTTWYSSIKTFGHTGFTGTCIWVDPEFNLVYVFLSNRVHPDMNNTKILTANIRPRIQEVIYRSIFEYCKNHTPAETK